MDIYGSESEDIAPFLVLILGDCVPHDDLTRTISYKNSYMTLPYNPNGKRFACYFGVYIDGLTRNEVMIYDNNINENLVDSFYSMFAIFGQPTLEIFANNNTYNNISGLAGGLQLFHSGPVTVTDTKIYNSTNFGE